MLQPLIRSFCVCLSLMTMALSAAAQTSLTARANNLQPTVDGASADSDRVRDGLTGPVRRVRTEVVKVSTVSGKTIEDAKHVLLETAEYDLKVRRHRTSIFRSPEAR